MLRAGILLFTDTDGQIMMFFSFCLVLLLCCCVLSAFPSSMCDFQPGVLLGELLGCPSWSRPTLPSQRLAGISSPGQVEQLAGPRLGDPAGRAPLQGPRGPGVGS